MSAAQSPIVLIPARLASKRLPNKPLADIEGEPMIVHVWRRAIEAEVGPVVVACGDAPIVEAITKVGGTAVLTDPNHPSGSDRIYEALQVVDPESRHDVIVNLQGDLPTLDPWAIRTVLAPLAQPEVDIATLVAIIDNERDRGDPSVVKAVVGLAPGATTARALYFSRATVPTGEGDHYHHIGIYAYRRETLARFVSMPPGVLERRERLEQLRALEAGMRIDAVLVDAVPLGVDTQDELETARRIIRGRGP
jgi:3-deoxy-manno-octulosonate cytidylyltransferase (CMP-KDO synthetase)